LVASEVTIIREGELSPSLCNKSFSYIDSIKIIKNDGGVSISGNKIRKNECS
jgi:hypothetical protein